VALNSFSVFRYEEKPRADEAAEETRRHSREEPVQTAAGFGEKRRSRDGKKR
jgi:hypothetical protein